MWTYNNTDELYHTNMYKNMNKKSKHELYHSDVYLGKDFSDGIKHYKYIRKYQKNGKTYYIYDNTEERINDAKANAANKTREQLGLKGFTTKDGWRLHGFKDPFTGKMSYSKYKILGSSYKQSKKDKVMEKAFAGAGKIVSDHKTQKMKDIPKKALAKGLSALSKVKMKIDDTIYKLKKKKK